jgi:hypothetical protein
VKLNEKIISDTAKYISLMFLNSCEDNPFKDVLIGFVYGIKKIEVGLVELGLITQEDIELINSSMTKAASEEFETDFNKELIKRLKKVLEEENVDNQE